MKKTRGVATLIITVALLLSALLITVYTAHFTQLKQSAATNKNRSAQAFQAAQAGIAFAIPYLGSNRSVVLANPVSGYISYGPTNTSLTNVTLANNSKFSIVYSNPIANNYRLIQITSTGQSDDGTASRTVIQQVYSGVWQYSLATLSSANIAGNATMHGIMAGQNTTITGSAEISGAGILSGNTVSIIGDATVAAPGVTAGGSISVVGSSSIASQSPNNAGAASLQTLSATTFFNNIFGMSKTQKQAESTYYASQPANMAALSGSVWINGNVLNTGTITIGSPSNPVSIIVNGNYTGIGNVIIYGFLYATGTITTAGGFSVQGAMASEGAQNVTGNSSQYDATILDMILSSGNFIPVAGTWRDF